MSRNNNGLGGAKASQNDEFYTQLVDIEKEMRYYKKYFKNKIIFLNCDDPKESNFFQYFMLNFTKLGIKKLISTHYRDDEPSYKLELNGDINIDGKINFDDIIKTPLKENGDFRSPECVKILKESDIVITNPPFSLFREYVAQLVEYNKKFLIIGNQNAITYKEIFPLIKENKMWLGVSLDGRNIWYRIPDSYEKYHKIVDGVKYSFVASTVWWTNLNHQKRNDELILYKEYNEEEYPKYDDKDIINVNKVKEIPMDYKDLMGVPITFIHKFNPKQFEIVGLMTSGKNLGVPYVNGKKIYARVVIKNKQL